MRIATSPFRQAKGWRRIRSADLLDSERSMPCSPARTSMVIQSSMALFDLQCGARDAVVCGLRWEWEVPLAELELPTFSQD